MTTVSWCVFVSSNEVSKILGYSKCDNGLHKYVFFSAFFLVVFLDGPCTVNNAIDSLVRMLVNSIDYCQKKLFLGAGVLFWDLQLSILPYGCQLLWFNVNILLFDCCLAYGSPLL